MNSHKWCRKSGPGNGKDSPVCRALCRSKSANLPYHDRMGTIEQRICRVPENKFF